MHLARVAALALLLGALGGCASAPPARPPAPAVPGDSAVPPGPAEETRSYERACAKGDGEGCFNLGLNRE